MTPAECVLVLDGSRNPLEGHRRDFEDPAFDRVGIGFAADRRYGHVVVVDYGADCRDATPMDADPDDHSAADFNRAALRWLEALRAQQDNPTFAGSTELAAAERGLAPWLLADRATAPAAARNIAGFNVWVERVPVVGTDRPNLVVRHDPDRLPDLE